jgi:hypothetical protein
VDLGALQNPSVLKALESAATVFDLKEGENAKVSLRVISSETAHRVFAAAQ